MEDIHPIRQPVPVGIDPLMIQVALWGMAGAVFLLIVLYFIRKWWKKKKAKQKDLVSIPVVPPYKAAMNRLAGLSRQTSLDPRLFYFELTRVLRKYIGETFNTHAAEMTSQEFIKSMKSIDLEIELKNEIIGFTRQCDPIKYAGVNPEPQSVRKDIKEVQKMIDAMENMIKMRVSITGD